MLAGDYLEVEAEQRGVDIALGLLTPNGSNILTVDSPNGPAGVEILATVASAPGHYGLMISSLPGEAAGTVRLRLIALRSATEGDRRFAEALARHAGASARNDPAARQRLRAERRQQLELLAGLDRPLLRARIERALGLLCLEDGLVRQALGHFEQALPATRVLSTDWELSALYNDAGYAARLSGEPDRARRSFEESLRLADALGHDLAAATALNNLGVLSESLSELEKALGFYDRAVVRWRRLGRLRSLGNTLHNIGLTYVSLGLLDEALDHLQQALELRRRTGDRQGEASTLTAYGWARSLEGDHHCALELYDQALVLRRALKDHRREAETLDHRGGALRALGRTSEALVDFEQALAMLRQSGNRVSEAHVLANLGDLLLDLGDPVAALARQRSALALFRAVGDRQGEAQTLINQAAVERQRGRLTMARQHYESALEVVESIRARLQSSAFRTSYVAARYAAYIAYVDLLLDLHSEKPDAGHATEAFEAVERSRARGLREGLAGKGPWWHHAGAELRLEEERLRERINLLESRRFRLLEGGAEDREVATLEAEIEGMIREYEKLEGRLRQSAGLRASPPHALSLSEIQAALDPGTSLLVYHLGEQEVVWLVGHGSFELRRLEAETGSTTSGNTAPTDTFATNTRIALARSAETGRLGQAEAEAARLAERVLGPVMGRLEQRVVIVAEGALATVPFTALPIRAAGSKGATAPLVELHEISHLPAASLLPLLRREREPVEGLLAMIADPVFKADDPRLSGRGESPEANQARLATATQGPSPAPIGERALEWSTRDLEVELFHRLPHAGLEAESILALAGERAETPAQLLNKVGPDASRELVLSGGVAGYRIVHFATHGWIDERHPSLSGIVLSRFDAAGRQLQGFLRVHEIERLDLPADLVVLSACRTGLGATVRGEGVVGMARAFFQAGVRRLVASFWRVDDRATAAFMQRFYRHLLIDGQTAASALANAQRWMRTETEWREPYYWGAFGLQGDWR
ncbi:MAG: CHAT domain-containing tetratricopeptide repeat protein [Acidobacteriota bacterium]